MTGTTAWLRQNGTNIRRPLALTIALGEISGILLILQTAFLVRIANAVIFQHAAVRSLLSVFIALIATAPVRFLVMWTTRRTAYECASRVKLDVRSRLMGHLRRLGPATLSSMRAGEVATIAVDAVEALEGYYSRYLPQRALSTLLPFTVLAAVFPLDWISGLVLLLTAVFLPVTMILIGEESHVRNQRLWATLARMSGRFLDILQGLTTVKMFGAARREAAEIERASDEYRIATLSVMRIAFLSSFMLELLSAVSIAIVAVLSGLRLMAGTMQFGRAYFILLAAPEYFLVLRSLGTFYHMRMEAMSAGERIADLLETQGFEGVLDASPRGSPPQGETFEVAFESVSRSFQSRVILDEISFTAAPGAHIALTGASGAGKSTVLNILLRFLRADSGRVLVGGLALELLPRDPWFERVAWLPQKPTLFHGTLRENIGLGRIGASSGEVERAARAACVDEFLPRLPSGLDTMVGEGGQGLSRGQVQRVALARLFLRRPSLVLLDEPTAHLDPASAELVSAAVQELGRGKTMIMVTHRGSAGMDRTLVLEAGKLRERA
ncbi:MAG: thiol reductant ABC exporter subunit CydD [Spirochaetia bacterium]